LFVQLGLNHNRRQIHHALTPVQRITYRLHRSHPIETHTALTGYHNLNRTIAPAHAGLDTWAIDALRQSINLKRNRGAPAPHRFRLSR
jgi:hypothetical protein